MKITYRVVNKAGNDVSEFESRLDADQYIQSKSSEELLIKEKKNWTWVEFFGFGLGYLFYKGFGISGVLSLLAGYFLFRYLSKRNNIYLSIFLSLLVGAITLLLSYYLATQIFYAS